MIFVCDGCNKDRRFHGDYGILIIDNKSGLKRYCRHCIRPKVGMPDVYFDGKPEENLADDPNTGKPRVFSSKAEKASYLKEKGIMEAGDRVHGAPLMVSRDSRYDGNKVNSREDIKLALKKVKEMGQDVRRQAYLKIMKEGRRYA